MKPLLATIAVLVLSGLASSCSSAPAPTAPAADTPASAQAEPTPYTGAPGATPSSTPQAVSSGDEETPDDIIPDFKELTFNAYPLQNIRPRIVEISVETHRSFSARARNRAQVEQAVREGIEASLKRSNIQVVSRSQNKLNFDIKDCRNMPDSAECVAIDAVLRTPKFELEVGGYSHNGYTTKDGAKSRLAGDLTRAYYGAINAVMERLNKQLEIVGSY